MNKLRVTYEGKEISIGLDVHKSFFTVTAWCEEAVVKRCRMPAGVGYLESFISKHFSEAEVRTCYEAGFSGFWLHRKLEARGISNIVVHPASVEIEAGNRVKTDKRDSLKLAQQLDAGRLRGIHVPSEEQEAHRQLTRVREQLMKARHRVMRQIKSKFYQFGLLAFDDKRVISKKMVQEVLEQELKIELRTAILIHLSTWNFFDEQLKVMKCKLDEQACQDKLEGLYRSVMGFGPLTARILSNELGDMSQFSNIRRLYSFTGLTPGEWSSGDNIRRGHISRQGSSRLRYILIEAAWRTIGKDESLREVYQRIAKRRGGKRAIVAVARKLIGRARAVIRDNKAYEAGYKEAA